VSMILSILRRMKSLCECLTDVHIKSSVVLMIRLVANLSDGQLEVHVLKEGDGSHLDPIACLLSVLYGRRVYRPYVQS